MITWNIFACGDEQHTSIVLKYLKKMYPRYGSLFGIKYYPSKPVSWAIEIYELPKDDYIYSGLVHSAAGISFVLSNMRPDFTGILEVGLEI